MRPENQGDLFLELIFWMQMSWIIPTLATEMWRIWKGTRMQPVLMPQREGRQEGWRIARGQPTKGGGRESQTALGEKRKAWWEKALPKRLRAGSPPFFERESCFFYPKWLTSDTIRLIHSFSLSPNFPGKTSLLLEKNMEGLVLLTLILNTFGCT